MHTLNLSFLSGFDTFMNIQLFAEQLKNAVTIKQAEALLDLYLSHFGFRYYAFTYYSGHVKSGRKLRYHAVSDALHPWHLHYLDQGYADVDRTLEENHTMTLPLFWDVQTQTDVAKNKREQRIRQESIDFGIDKGLSVPVHGPNHDFVVLTLHQFRHESCLNHYELHQFEWLSAACIYYHHIRKILNLQKKYCLTV